MTKMATAQTTITYRDPRTGKFYAMRRDPFGAPVEMCMARIRQAADHDYFETLSVEEQYRIKKQDTDFTCPKCMKKTEVTTRKEKMVSGFLFFIGSHLIDIHNCNSCRNDFTDEELHNARSRVYDENSVLLRWLAEKKEKVKITDEVIVSATHI